MKLNDRELNEMVAAMQTKPKWDYSGSFDLQPPADWDDLDEATTNDSIEIEIEDEYEDDGQPSEYDEWQDFNGGDDWDHGQYDY